MKFVTQFPE